MSKPKKLLGQSLRVAAYLKARRAKLDLLEKMWADPHVQCYNDKEMPDSRELTLGSIFLAGPTSRHQILEYNWRCEAVAYLREAGFEGVIYVPEPRGLEKNADFTDRDYIHWWESNRLLSATYPIFWIPRDKEELLGLNTNFEWGYTLRDVIAQEKPGKILIGWPDEAERMGLPWHYTVERNGLKRYNTLRRVCFAAVAKVPPEDIAGLNSDRPR